MPDLRLRRLAGVAASPVGLAAYAATRRTPTGTYVAFRKAYGVAPSAFERMSRAAAPRPVATPRMTGLVGSPDQQIDALACLRCQGYAVLDTLLDETTVSALRDLALRVPVRPIPDDGSVRAPFDRQAPAAPRYDIDEVDLLSSPVVQRLVSDASLRDLAGRYLGGEPVNDLVAMWWTAATGERASSAAAQLFHADRDRIAFIKLFVYLTDVDEGHGPHVYVRGSHRDLPRRLRADRRFSDDEVLARYPAKDLVTVTGPAGTMFIADTRGLHKGTPPEEGDRLVFQIEYARGLFGAPYVSTPVDVLASDLRPEFEAHPRVYRRLLGKR